MTQKSFFYRLFILLSLLFSCSQPNTERAESRKMENKNMEMVTVEDAMTEPAVANNSESGNGFISSTAAVEMGKDSTRKFIRTANMRFRVKSVIKATYKTEDIIGESGGFVSLTNLRSNIDKRTITPISADSSLETIYFTVSNSMTLRVPNTKLDTTVKSIATLIDYLDYRIIKAEDVSLEILSNKLRQDRIKQHRERLGKAIDERGKKLNETTNAEETLLNRQEEADEEKLANLTLMDKINFSTINLDIYQRQEIKDG